MTIAHGLLPIRLPIRLSRLQTHRVELGRQKDNSRWGALIWAHSIWGKYPKKIQAF
ncbi:MAG: hypothetical protein CM15mP47_4010 [Methanobacteriota archaeon]|nr:MAG: hypothetical protein CM15mP47_4010 [Euryarchaeota archaeon]